MSKFCLKTFSVSTGHKYRSCMHDQQKFCVQYIWTI